jgi:hypothetical protein
MTNKKNYILIEFNEKTNEVEFNYDLDKAEFFFTAFMGMEAMTCKETGLDIVDVREVIDEMKGKHQVKMTEPKDPNVVEDNESWDAVDSDVNAQDGAETGEIE